MNPKKLGKLDNHKQEQWKLPLPQFIEKCYLKSFKRARPEKIIALGKKPSTTASKPAKSTAAGRPEGEVQSLESAQDGTAGPGEGETEPAEGWY